MSQPLEIHLPLLRLRGKVFPRSESAQEGRYSIRTGFALELEPEVFDQREKLFDSAELCP